MFCYQCQETAAGKGCTVKGVCGKEAQTSDEMDVLLEKCKNIGILINSLKEKPIENERINRFILDSLFTTITNANFDIKSIESRVNTADTIIKNLEEQCDKKNIKVTFFTKNPNENEDITSLKSLILFGLKGMAAYAKHALNLNYANDDIFKFIYFALSEISRTDITLEELISLVNETGKYGVEAMAILDKANTETYGNPEITKVNIGVGKNPGILISGHDLKDLEDLLEQSKNSGVDIYTHSEMLPAHYYPKFKKYSHFAGNYGSAWWKQKEEFSTFNGPVLFTTNCIVPPLANANYSDKIYTTGSTGFPGAKTIAIDKNGKKDFSEIIAHAKKCVPPTEIEKGEIIGGFAHEQVFALADKVVDAVKSGSIKKFIVMAGCDGRMKSRDYYTEFAKQIPKDCVILTAGCAKYRYNKLPLGDINGIPRVLDAGQCNDSYSLALIALKLKEVFKLNDVNDLPIFYNIAWYEQKAVIVLLSLLYLGVKKIHLGPTLPAFLSPNITKFLVENFEISGISTVEEDLKLI